MSTPMLCFHHAGGASSTYRSWQGAADRGIDTVLVDIPSTRPVTGRRVYGDDLSLVSHIIETHVEVLRSPHLLYGHSMGGLLAYLVARRTSTRAGFVKPTALIVAASWSPRMPPSIDVDQLSDTELVEVLVRIGGIPASLARRLDWLASMLPMIRDDLRICGRYRHDPIHDAIAAPIYVIGASDDSLVSREQTEAWAGIGSVVQIEYRNGGHFFETDRLGLRDRVFEIAQLAAGRAASAPQLA